MGSRSRFDRLFFLGFEPEIGQSRSEEQVDVFRPRVLFGVLAGFLLAGLRDREVGNLDLGRLGRAVDLFFRNKVEESLEPDLVVRDRLGLGRDLDFGVNLPRRAGLGNGLGPALLLRARLGLANGLEAHAHFAGRPRLGRGPLARIIFSRAPCSGQGFSAAVLLLDDGPDHGHGERLIRGLAVPGLDLRRPEDLRLRLDVGHGQNGVDGSDELEHVKGLFEVF
jgi:hypothetical protein